MTHFNNVKSYEDLKAQYRTLALANHPDAGGDDETMKAINNEYDQLFIIWKRRNAVANNETASSTRSEFYTQNGWKESRYNSNLSLKEIACMIREFIKIHYNDCKFSVTTSYASMCQSLDISLMESPHRAYKTFDELTEDENTYNSEYRKVIRKYVEAKNLGSWYKEEINNIIRPMYDMDFGTEAGIYFPKFLTEEIKEPVQAVEDYAKSFNYSDCDGQIDYFNVNFWFSGVEIGKWNKEYKVVERTKKHVANVEYENVEVKKTRTYKTLKPKDIETPAEFKLGQFFQLKTGFNHGCYSGTVYQIDNIYEGKFSTIYAYKMGKGYKKMCKGDVRGNNFSCTVEDLNTWIEKGAISFVELVEVTKTEEYTSTVRRPKKQTGLSTEVRPAADTENATQDTPEAAEAKEYTITPDTDTRDNSALWVVKFVKHMDRDEYKQTAKTLKKINGVYSRFKKGFIFNYDPTEKLAQIYGDAEQGKAQEQEQAETSNTQSTVEKEQEEQRAKEVAENIIDTSTDIIIDLHLRPSEYIYNQKYKERMTEYINSKKEQITQSVIEKINIKDLRIFVEKVLQSQQEGGAA